MAAEKEYLTVGSVGKGEYTEKKSRFLGEIHPVSTESEAAAVVAQARKRYYDARHHCYAWVLGEDGAVKKASDDGEPSGTAGIPMLNVLRGPRPLSPQDIQLLKDQLLKDRNYVARSHFNGATPDNDYTPTEPYSVTVSDNPNSYMTEGYATLYIRSGGADSPRPITLRKKPSTGEWFLWNHVGLLPGIRVPASQDPWR